MTEEHGGNIYAAARQQGGVKENFIDYSANINPLGISNYVRQAILNGISMIEHYPDTEAFELKRAISTRYQVTDRCITAGNGAVELLYILLHALKPKRALVPAPTFSEYERASKASGSQVVYLPLNKDEQFFFSTSVVIEQMQAGDMLFLCNPNNPTGNLLTVDELYFILKEADKKKTFVVVDESFLDFLYNDAEHTCRKFIDGFSNLLIIHSLTKFYALPGLRLGFALTQSELTNKLHQMKDPWNVNVLAQMAGVAALQDEVYQWASRKLVQEENKRMYEEFKKIPTILPYMPSVNFIFLDVMNTGLTSTQWREILMQQGILVRDCKNYQNLQCGQYLRVAVKDAVSNQTLLKKIRSVAESMGGQL